MEKDNKGIKNEAIRAILQSGVPFTITRIKKSFLQRVLRLKGNRTFTILPINLGTLFAISSVILSMKEDIVPEKEDLFEFGVQSVVNNQEALIEIVALAIMNEKITSLYKRWKKARLKQYIKYNLSAHELAKLLALVISQMDVTDFLACIVSVQRKMNLTETRKESILTTGKSSGE